MKTTILEGLSIWSAFQPDRAIDRLTLLPDAKLSDKAAVMASLRRAIPLPFEAILLGDGDRVFQDAREAYFRILDGLPRRPMRRLLPGNVWPAYHYETGLEPELLHRVERCEPTGWGEPALRDRGAGAVRGPFTDLEETRRAACEPPRP